MHLIPAGALARVPDVHLGIADLRRVLQRRAVDSLLPGESAGAA